MNISTTDVEVETVGECVDASKDASLLAKGNSQNAALVQEIPKADLASVGIRALYAAAEETPTGAPDDSKPWLAPALAALAGAVCCCFLLFVLVRRRNKKEARRTTSSLGDGVQKEKDKSKGRMGVKRNAVLEFFSPSKNTKRFDILGEAEEQLLFIQAEADPDMNDIDREALL